MERIYQCIFNLLLLVQNSKWTVKMVYCLQETIQKISFIHSLEDTQIVIYVRGCSWLDGNVFGNWFGGEWRKRKSVSSKWRSSRAPSTIAEQRWILHETVREALKWHT